MSSLSWSTAPALLPNQAGFTEAGPRALVTLSATTAWESHNFGVPGRRRERTDARTDSGRLPGHLRNSRSTEPPPSRQPSPAHSRHRARAAVVRNLQGEGAASGATEVSQRHGVAAIVHASSRCRTVRAKMDVRARTCSLHRAPANADRLPAYEPAPGEPVAGPLTVLGRTVAVEDQEGDWSPTPTDARVWMVHVAGALVRTSGGPTYWCQGAMRAPPTAAARW